MPAAADFKKLKAQILAGGYDGSLVEIVQAIQERFQNSTHRQLWRIRFDGDEWTEETVTIGEIADVERAVGRNWHSVDPASSAQHLVAVIAAHVAHRDDIKMSEALKQAGKVPMGELTEVLSHYEKADAPKE